MNNNINNLPGGDFKVEKMKQVEIGGQLVQFQTMKNDSVMTESKEHNFIGYSKVYFIDGQRYESSTPLKFYR
jgi:hypothetical protein